MAKQQKAKKEVEVKKKKVVSRTQGESQFMAVLNKKVRAALRQYDYNKDKSGQYIGPGIFVSGDNVKHACSNKR